VPYQPGKLLRPFAQCGIFQRGLNHRSNHWRAEAGLETAGSGTLVDAWTLQFVACMFSQTDNDKM
jgi:hypothetical protein